MCKSTGTVMGFVLSQAAYYHHDTGYTTDYLNLIDFILSLEDKFEKINLIMPITYGKKGKIKLNVPVNIKILPVEYAGSGSRFWRIRLLSKGLWDMAKAIRSPEFGDSRVTGFVGLSGIGMLGFYVCRLFCRRPSFFLIRGHRIRTTYRSKQGGLRRFIKCARIRFYANVLNRQISKGDYVFTQGDELKNIFGVKGRNVFALNAVVDKSFLLRRGALLEKSNVEKNEITLLYVGRLSGEKNVSGLINVFKKITDKYDNIRLKIAGSGPEEKKLVDQIKRLQLNEKVKMLGFVPHGPEMLSLYRDGDIFVMSSFTEGLPRALIEAMGSGCIAVLSNVGGIPYIIEDGVNGLLFTPANENDIYEKLVESIKMLSQSEKRKSMTLKAFETATKYTFQERGSFLAEKLRLCIDGCE